MRRLFRFRIGVSSSTQLIWEDRTTRRWNSQPHIGWQEGSSYDANYSWAHNISDAQGDAPTAFQGETRYGLADLNRFDISANRGNVVGTRRQRLLVTGTYELPFGKGRQWLNLPPVSWTVSLAAGT